MLCPRDLLCLWPKSLVDSERTPLRCPLPRLVFFMWGAPPSRPVHPSLFVFSTPRYLGLGFTAIMTAATHTFARVSDACYVWHCYGSPKPVVTDVMGMVSSPTLAGVPGWAARI